MALNNEPQAMSLGQSLAGFTRTDLLNLLIQSELRLNSDGDSGSYVIKEEKVSGDFVIQHRSSSGDTTIWRMTKLGNITFLGTVSFSSLSLTGDLDMNNNNINNVNNINMSGDINMNDNSITQLNNLDFDNGIYRGSINLESDGEFDLHAFSNSGTNAFRFRDNTGTTLLKILNNGNIGIGTTSPTELLEVYGNSATIKLVNNVFAVGQKATFLFNHISLQARIESYLPGGNDVDLLFYTMDSFIENERMRITGNGNIGIGTNNPTQKLQVAGSIFINQDNSAFAIGDSGLGTLGFVKKSGSNSVIASSSGSSIIFSNSNQTSILDNISTSTLTELMRLTSDGKLGIGRTPTTYLLELEDTTNASIFFKNSNNSIGALVGLDSGGDLILSQGNSANETRIVHNSSDRLVINNSYSYFLNSNVGFGITTPNAARIVIGNNDFNDTDGILYFNHDSPWGFFQGGNGTSASLDLKTLSDNKKFRILNANNSVVSETTAAISGSTFYYNGNVGIGKTPSEVLDVSGNINADGNILGDGIAINNSTLEFRTQSTSVVTQWFSPGGNLQLKNPSAGNVEMLNSAGGYLSLADSTGDVLYVKSGNVGIGTSSAVSKLDVRGKGFFYTSGIAVNAENTDTSGTGQSQAAVLNVKHNTSSTNQVFTKFFRSITTSEGDIRTDGSGNLVFQNASDISLKENIIEYDSYNKLKQIRVVEYNWKDKNKDNKVGRIIGFIAQELKKSNMKCVGDMYLKRKKIKEKKIIKKIITKKNNKGEEYDEETEEEIEEEKLINDETSKVLGVSHQSLIPFLWSACRKLISDKEDLENKYNNLLSRIEDLEKMIKK